MKKEKSKQTQKTQSNSSNVRGITLIALIITIIVMLILVAVTVSVVVNSGLFKHAETASESWKQAQETEQNIGAGNVQVGDYGSINEYLENNPLTNPELDRRNIKVGDYIAYTPDVASDYSLTSKVSGNTDDSGNAIDQTIPQESLKWRVMNINEDGSVELISETPTTTKATFKGALGYNNGVLVLNDICKKQYSNNSLGATSRSINLIDIEKHFTSQGTVARDSFQGNDEKYGNTKEYTGTLSNVPDIYEHTGKTLQERSKDYYTAPTTSEATKKDSLIIKQTYYRFGPTTQKNYIDHQTFYEIIFSIGKHYWLASRYSICGASHALFGLRIVYSADLCGDALFLSNNTLLAHSDFIRPVVTLGSNIKISTTGGTAENPRTISL